MKKEKITEEEFCTIEKELLETHEEIKKSIFKYHDLKIELYTELIRNDKLRLESEIDKLNEKLKKEIKEFEASNEKEILKLKQEYEYAK
ncbi:MAG: hypothetical protein AM1032_000040 [Mycoplasmataceae bacterium]|nr:MAG: hypothetical protein AM1032_000040 [Mycoplasmataceae bacterium]